jgi:hypothetical protein
MEAMRMGPITYLAPEEAQKYGVMAATVMHRPWDMWRDELEESGRA